jgi:ubiquinone/menaquinone biosynthesis C-methylase UbiE
VSREPSVAPATYARWRAAALGRITESLEVALVLELARDLAGRRVLDVGTGDGTYACAAAERGARVVAVDPSVDMLDAASRRARERALAIELREGSVQRLPFEDESFDVVVAVTVLCFVENPRLAVHEIVRVLAPGGRLVLGELHRASSWAAWRRIKGWFGSTAWTGVHFWTKRELVALVEHAGLLVEQVRGAVHYPPVGFAAKATRRLDPMLGRAQVPGAAFIAVAARKR